MMIQKGMVKMEINFGYSSHGEKFQNVGTIMQFANKWINGEQFSVDEVTALVSEVVQFVFDSHGCALFGDKLPRIKLEPSGEMGGSNGAYNPSLNVIQFNFKNFYELLNFGSQYQRNTNYFAQVVNTIAHEIEHYFQYALIGAVNDGRNVGETRFNEYDKLQGDPNSFGSAVSEQGRSMDPSGMVRDFLEIAPYFGEQWALVENNPELVDTISYAYYLSDHIEEGARASGGKISRDLMGKIWMLARKQGNEKLSEWAKASFGQAIDNPTLWGDKQDNAVEYDTINQLENGINNLDEFIAFAKNAEKDLHISNRTFQYAVNMFLKKRNKDELVEVYRNAIYHGLKNLASNTWMELRLRTSAIEMRLIQERIAKNLACGAINTTNSTAMLSKAEKLDESSYSLNFEWLSVGDKVEIIQTILGQGKFIFAAEFIKNNLSGEQIRAAFTDGVFAQFQNNIKTQIDAYFHNQGIRPIQEKYAFEQLALAFNLEDYFDHMTKTIPMPDAETMRNQATSREQYLLNVYGEREYIKILERANSIQARSKIEHLREEIGEENSLMVSDSKIYELAERARVRRASQMESEAINNAICGMVRDEFVGIEVSVSKKVGMQKIQGKVLDVEVHNKRVYVCFVGDEEKGPLRVFWSKNQEDFLETNAYTSNELNTEYSISNDN